MIYAFSDQNIDYSACGGKGASLAKLSQAGFPVPNGFVVPAGVYLEYEKTGVISKEVEQEILSMFDKLGLSRVAVRSSAVAEDSADNSFAGQLETFLNVSREKLVESIVACYKGTESERYKSYTRKNSIDYNPVAVVVQEMIPSDVSGVAFSKNPVDSADEIVVEAAYGLGEAIVQGLVDPDRFVVDPSSLKVTEESIGTKKERFNAKTNALEENDQDKATLNHAELQMLSKEVLKIEAFYKCPQDVEWAMFQNKLYILQARPITTITSADQHSIMEDNLPTAILTGVASSRGLYSGKVRLVHSVDDLNNVQEGEILVCSKTTPDYTAVFEKVGAVVTETGGMTSHAAVVARELGKPSVVGTKDAMTILHDGQVITVFGSIGKVYDGIVEVDSTDVESIKTEGIEDHFLLSNNDIDNFLSYMLISLPPEHEIWPMSPSQMLPFFDMNQALDLLYKLRQLDEEGLSDQKIAELFITPARVKTMIINVAILGSKMAHKLLPEKVTVEDQVYLTEKLLRLCKILCNNDNKYLYGRTLFFKPEQIDELEPVVLEREGNDLKVSNDFSSTTFLLNWSFVWDIFSYTTNTLHGPYELSSAHGADSKLMIREFDFGDLDEVWPLAAELPCHAITFYQVYQTKNLWMSVGARLRGEGDFNHLKKQIILIDGEYASDEDLVKLSEYFKELTAKQTNYINEMDKRELIVRSAKLSYFSFKNFYTYFKEDWFPEDQVRASVNELYEEIFTPKPEGTKRSEAETRKFWDPRNDYLDF
jgi:pyruvate,water dikinase